jgi:carboxymethylenebutenolidase
VHPVIDRLEAPLLLLVAGADFRPVSAFQQLDAELSKANKAHEMHVYEDAPHSFFDRSYEEWKDACADAWERILGFTAAPSGVGA